MGLAYQHIANSMNQMYGAVAPSAIGTHYFALMSALPGLGGGGVEASGGTGPYARVSKTNNSTTYPTASVGAVSKYAGVDIAFTGLPAGNWAGIAIYDASTSGTLLGFAKFVDTDGNATTITTASGDSLTLPANSGLLIAYTDTN